MPAHWNSNDVDGGKEPGCGQRYSGQHHSMVAGRFRRCGCSAEANGHCVKIPNIILFLLFGRNCIFSHGPIPTLIIALFYFCSRFSVADVVVVVRYCSFAALFHLSQFHFAAFFSLQFSFARSFDCFESFYLRAPETGRREVMPCTGIVESSNTETRHL